jgi:hypothetical protein
MGNERRKGNMLDAGVVSGFVAATIWILVPVVFLYAARRGRGYPIGLLAACLLLAAGLRVADALINATGLVLIAAFVLSLLALVVAALTIVKIK